MRGFPDVHQGSIAIFPCLVVLSSWIVSSVVGVRKSADYLHITYHVSPPGDEKTPMDGMKLRFQFKGRHGGKITVWWDRPWKYRNNYAHHKFGLGAVELVHDLKVLDPEALTKVILLRFLPNAMLKIPFESKSRMPGPLICPLTPGSNRGSRETTCWAAAWISTSWCIFLLVEFFPFICLQRHSRMIRSDSLVTL